jgi:hypothetical protein
MRSTLDWYGKRRRRLTDRRNRLPFLGQTLRILFAPFQRLPDDFALIRASEMSQEWHALYRFELIEKSKTTRSELISKAP